jgi:hypothetical protein
MGGNFFNKINQIPNWQRRKSHSDHKFPNKAVCASEPPIGYTDKLWSRRGEPDEQSPNQDDVCGRHGHCGAAAKLRTSPVANNRHAK